MKLKLINLSFAVLFLSLIVSCATTKDIAKSQNPLENSSLNPANSVDLVESSITENFGDGDEKAKENFSQPHKFNEVWGYVLDGREASLKNSSDVLTDIAYFGAGINTFGKLVGVPDLESLKPFIKEKKTRVHLVIADSGASLTHFTLSEEYPLRKQFIKDIIKASAPFDGVQIDFESVPKSDKEDFLSFLKILRKKLPKNKILSVALPARLKTLSKDQYNYEEINKIVDRIVVMAYDEHWSTSRPGPVASLEWCQRIMNYSLSQIPSEKLIMGLPAYGRVWDDDDTIGAYGFVGVKNLIKDFNIEEISRKNDIPTVKFSKKVNFTLYYDDLYSLNQRLSLYEKSGVKNISFWRIGLEDSEIWNFID